MSIFTYHIPKGAVYNSLDVINILNNDYRHLTLAQNHGTFYSLGTIHESFTTPTLEAGAGLGLLYGSTSAAFAPIAPVFFLFGITSLIQSFFDFLKHKPTRASISDDSSNHIINDHFAVDNKGKWYYHQEPGNEYDVFTETFTAQEIAYLLNTNDIHGTLTHQVPVDYSVLLNGESYYNVAVLDT